MQNSEGHIVATELLLTIKKGRDAVKKAKDFLTKPLKEHVKNIDALFTATLDALERADTAARGKVRDYLIAEDKRQQDEQARIDRDNAIARRSAKALGEDAPSKIEEPASVETRAETGAGSSSGTKYRDYEVVDISMVPPKFVKQEIRRQLVLDALNKDSVEEIPGLRVVDDFRLQVRN